MSEFSVQLGHNNPPSPIEEYEGQIKPKYYEYFTQAQSLIELQTRVPEEITNEEDAKSVSDYIKKVKELQKTLDSIREGEKQPHLEKCRIVDGAFGKWLDKFKEIRKHVEPIQAKWIEAKKAAERRKKEEELERKRQEEAEKLRIAQEKEEAARKAREEAERKAREETERLEAERRRIDAEAEAKRKAQEAELAKMREETERAERERQAEIDRLKAQKAELERKDKEEKDRIQNEIAEKERAAKEAERAAKEAERAAKAEAERIEREKKEAERKIREQERAAEEQAKEAERNAKALDRESKYALEDAAKLERQGNRLENAKEDHVRVRGDQGSISTSRIDWDGHMVNRDEIDLEALRHHLREDDINHAIKQFIKAGGRDLKGAFIFEDAKLQVR